MSHQTLPVGLRNPRCPYRSPPFSSVVYPLGSAGTTFRGAVDVDSSDGVTEAAPVVSADGVDVGTVDGVDVGTVDATVVLAVVAAYPFVAYAYQPGNEPKDFLPLLVGIVVSALAAGILLPAAPRRRPEERSQSRTPQDPRPRPRGRQAC